MRFLVARPVLEHTTVPAILQYCHPHYPPVPPRAQAGRKAPEAATESFFTQTTEPAAEPAAPPPRMPSFEEAVPPPPQQPQQQRRAGGIGGWAKGVTRAKSSASTDSVSKRIPNKKPGAK